jgi:hypothetical protein
MYVVHLLVCTAISTVSPYRTQRFSPSCKFPIPRLRSDWPCQYSHASPSNKLNVWTAVFKRRSCSHTVTSTCPVGHDCPSSGNRTQNSSTLRVSSRLAHCQLTVTDLVTVLSPHAPTALEHGAIMKSRDVSVTAVLSRCIQTDARNVFPDRELPVVWTKL